jgi:hypothetical protein
VVRSGDITALAVKLRSADFIEVSEASRSVP